MPDTCHAAPNKACSCDPCQKKAANLLIDWFELVGATMSDRTQMSIRAIDTLSHSMKGEPTAFIDEIGIHFDELTNVVSY